VCAKRLVTNAQATRGTTTATTASRSGRASTETATADPASGSVTDPSEDTQQKGDSKSRLFLSARSADQSF
jgi:hypothetical protein